MTFSEFMAILPQIHLIPQARILILIMPEMFWLAGLNTGKIAVLETGLSL